MLADPDNYRARLGAWVKARLLRDPDAVKIDCEGLDLFVVRDVLPPDLRTRLMTLIDEVAVPSEVMSLHPDPEFRTSYSGYVPPEHPDVEEANRLIHAVVGIPRELGEPLQGQRYAVGQQFKPHWDYFIPGEDYFLKTWPQGGQRTWTAMAFLNTPEDGGRTQFTELDISVRPIAGTLLVWNNLTPEGDINKLSMHQGMPVIAGTKYILTKWHREAPFRHLTHEEEAALAHPGART
jgi:prolyl 4-hydroxylase